MRTLLPIVLTVPLLFAACSNGNDAANEPAGISDEAYLAITCTGLQRFSDAVVAKASADEIRDAIRDYADALKAITPPADVAKFHRDFIVYLEEAEAEPLLLSQTPPLPPDKVRRRLAALEPTVAECKNPTFFAEPTQ